MAKDNDPRDFSLYGGPMKDYGHRTKYEYAFALLRDSVPCKKVKTRASGKEVKTPARVMLSAFELDLLQRALSGYLRETMKKPRHFQKPLEDMIEVLMFRLKVMEEGEP